MGAPGRRETQYYQKRSFMNSAAEIKSSSQKDAEQHASRLLRWNIVLTLRPAPGAVHELLDGLRAFGEFRITPFHYVCTGWVNDTTTFLDALLEAQQAGRHWTRHIARVVPLDSTFEFVPESLKGKLQSAVQHIAERIEGGTCFVRVERRGLAESLDSPELELTLAEGLFAAVEARGKAVRTAFDDPDYIVAVETLDTQCGIALITRYMRERYPFVRVR
jgi:tRNA(Ser,Leu) C12 N-acetylase TAN1